MSALAYKVAQIDGGTTAQVAVAAEAQRPYAEKLVALRDTLVVFGMQIVFRATMFLRHLNY